MTVHMLFQFFRSPGSCSIILSPRFMLVARQHSFSLFCGTAAVTEQR